MLGLLAFGGWIFWSIIGIFSIITLISLEKEAHGWLVLCTFPVVSLLGFGAPLPFIMALNVKLVITAIFCYIAVGGGWSIFKWWRHVRAMVTAYKNDNKTTTVYTRDFEASNHKAKIIVWIAYWPWSLFWAITSDLFNNLFDILASCYKKISDKAVAEIRELEQQRVAEKANQDKR